MCIASMTSTSWLSRSFIALLYQDKSILTGAIMHVFKCWMPKCLNMTRDVRSLAILRSLPQHACEACEASCGCIVALQCNEQSMSTLYTTQYNQVSIGPIERLETHHCDLFKLAQDLPVTFQAPSWGYALGCCPLVILSITLRSHLSRCAYLCLLNRWFPSWCRADLPCNSSSTPYHSIPTACQDQTRLIRLQVQHTDR